MLQRNYDEEMNNCRCSVVFVVEDEVGGLMKVIQVFKVSDFYAPISFKYP